MEAAIAAPVIGSNLSMNPSPASVELQPQELKETSAVVSYSSQVQGPQKSTIATFHSYFLSCPTDQRDMINCSTAKVTKMEEAEGISIEKR